MDWYDNIYKDYGKNMKKVEKKSPAVVSYEDSEETVFQCPCCSQKLFIQCKGLNNHKLIKRSNDENNKFGCKGAEHSKNDTNGFRDKQRFTDFAVDTTQKISPIKNLKVDTSKGAEFLSSCATNKQLNSFKFTLKKKDRAEKNLNENVKHDTKLKEEISFSKSISNVGKIAENKGSLWLKPQEVEEHVVHMDQHEEPKILIEQLKDPKIQPIKDRTEHRVYSSHNARKKMLANAKIQNIWKAGMAKQFAPCQPRENYVENLKEWKYSDVDLGCFPIRKARSLITDLGLEEEVSIEELKQDASKNKLEADITYTEDITNTKLPLYKDVSHSHHWSFGLLIAYHCDSENEFVGIELLSLLDGRISISIPLTDMARFPRSNIYEYRKIPNHDYEVKPSRYRPSICIESKYLEDNQLQLTVPGICAYNPYLTNDLRKRNASLYIWSDIVGLIGLSADEVEEWQSKNSIDIFRSLNVVKLTLLSSWNKNILKDRNQARPKLKLINVQPLESQKLHDISSAYLPNETVRFDDLYFGYPIDSASPLSEQFFLLRSKSFPSLEIYAHTNQCLKIPDGNDCWPLTGLVVPFFHEGRVIFRALIIGPIQRVVHNTDDRISFYTPRAVAVRSSIVTHSPQFRDIVKLYGSSITHKF